MRCINDGLVKWCKLRRMQQFSCPGLVFDNDSGHLTYGNIMAGAINPVAIALDAADNLYVTLSLIPPASRRARGYPPARIKIGRYFLATVYG
jgi:hypothetical protein